jgi:aromatic-L-amino-acid decarboxylase
MQVRHLVTRITKHPDLELLAPAPLNIACFRYTPAHLRSQLSESALNAINEELLLRLQEQGIAVPSSTVLGGRFALRVAHVNHRTRQTDVDQLLDGVLRLGADVIRDRVEPLQ